MRRKLRAPQPYAGDDVRCQRCATALPSAATVCLTCGLPLTIPVQLPAPAPPAQREAA